MRRLVYINAGLWTCAAVVGFAGYGGLRTMQENFGFNLVVLLRSIGFIFCPVAVVCVVGLMAFGRSKRVTHRMLLAVIGIALGSVCSEGQLLLDERSFVKESQNAFAHDHSLAIFSRSRWKPNGSAQLVFVKDQGPHATD
jgi:hypothetical protein